jgi:putative DNA-invertase from lambdoid prophage Rac
MAVYGYIRVSTSQQASEGESLTVQERTLHGYAQMKGWKLDHVFCEAGISGSVPLRERPQGAKLLTMVEAGDIVVTPKLDRMFRSASDALSSLETFKRQSISLHMLDLGGDVTAHGIAKLVFTILSAVAEAERDRIRERITDIKRDQRRRGRYLGGSVPFAHTVDPDGNLVADQAIVQAVTKLRAEGLSLRAIAARFEGRVSHVAVGNLLRTRHDNICIG